MRLQGYLLQLYCPNDLNQRPCYYQVQRQDVYKRQRIHCGVKIVTHNAFDGRDIEEAREELANVRGE